MPTFWDLFCGCGGMSIGFENRGFEGKFAVDWIEEIANTYAKNHPNTRVFNGDIRKIDFKKLEHSLGRPDIIIGGPPCEGFSSASNSCDDATMRAPKRELYFQAIRAVNVISPKTFLFENSPNAGKKYAEPILNAFKKINRDVKFHMLKAADCGVPQVRRRSFLTDTFINFPSVPNVGLSTPRKVFAGLPTLRVSKDPLHQLRPATKEFTQRIKNTPPGNGLYKHPDKPGEAWSYGNIRIHPDKPTMSVMLRAEFCHWKEARKLTFREYLRLMCVPDTYKFFYKTYGKMKMLVGSFLPPPTAEVWADEIKIKLGNIKKAEDRTVSEKELELIRKDFTRECEVIDTRNVVYMPFMFDAIQSKKLQSMTDTELILTKSIFDHNICTADKIIEAEMSNRSLVIKNMTCLELACLLGEDDSDLDIDLNTHIEEERSENSEDNIEESIVVKFIPIDKKVADDKQIVFGVVLEPNTVDSQGDIISEEEIEKAAHLWLARYQDRGFMHSKIVNSKIEIYESYLAPSSLTINNQTVKKGTWLLMYHVLDSEMWQKIKSGEMEGFSMGGFARRVKV